MQAGRADSRFRGVIDLDGDVWGDVEAKGTHKPFLVLLNEPGPPVHIPPKMANERAGEWRSVLAKSRGLGSVLTVGPAYHFSFTDAPFLLTHAELGKNGATLDAALGRTVITSLILRFIATGKPSSAFHGPSDWMSKHVAPLDGP